WDKLQVPSSAIWRQERREFVHRLRGADPPVLLPQGNDVPTAAGSEAFEVAPLPVDRKAHVRIVVEGRMDPTGGGEVNDLANNRARRPRGSSPVPTGPALRGNQSSGRIRGAYGSDGVAQPPSARSTTAAAASARSSRQGAAAIWTPTGMPSTDVPARTTTAG